MWVLLPGGGGAPGRWLPAGELRASLHVLERSPVALGASPPNRGAGCAPGGQRWPSRGGRRPPAGGGSRAAASGPWSRRPVKRGTMLGKGVRSGWASGPSEQLADGTPCERRPRGQVCRGGGRVGTVRTDVGAARKGKERKVPNRAAEHWEPLQTKRSVKTTRAPEKTRVAEGQVEPAGSHSRQQTG